MPLQREAEVRVDDQDFLAPRKCMREPIPEILWAAEMLNRAVDAHLAGDRATASDLIAQTNLPAIRAWTESLWGSKRNNPDQQQYVRLRDIPGHPKPLDKKDRVPARMPTAAEKKELLDHYGWNCAFCGIPVIRKEVRQAIRAAYPDALSWGGTNQSQHAALQCMWVQYDHLLPHCYGGTNSIDNMAITCAPCNYGRLDSTLAQVGLIDPRTRPVQKASWDGLERFLAHR